MLEERSAGAVLFLENSNIFLLLNYPSGHWDFVKGKIEDREDPYQTVIRETKEETGITDLQFVNNFEEKIEYNFKLNGDTVHKQVIFFLAKTNTKNVKLSHEHLDYVWLDYENALQKITYESAREILKKAKNHLETKLA